MRCWARGLELELIGTGHRWWRRLGAFEHGQLGLEGVAPFGEEREPLDRFGEERGLVRFGTEAARVVRG